MKLRLDIEVENREEVRQALYNAADNIIAGEDDGYVYLSGLDVGSFALTDKEDA